MRRTAVILLIANAILSAATPAEDAEAALRARVEKFYQLQMEKKFRQAESLVADDTKDMYFAGAKADVSGFRIAGVDLAPDLTHATVHVRLKTQILMVAVGKMLPFESAIDATWKLENGEWVWYVDASKPVATPFGAMAVRPPDAAGAPPSVAPNGSALPSIESLRKMVSVDKRAVTLTETAPVAEVVLANRLPGSIEIGYYHDHDAIIGVEIEHAQLGGGETSAIHFRRLTSKPSTATVRVTATPPDMDFDIQVTIR